MKKYLILCTVILLVILTGVWVIGHSQKVNLPHLNGGNIVPKTTVSEPTRTSSPSPTSKKIVSVTVTLTPTGFSPQIITITPGTKVIWINKSGVEATVNSDPHPTHTAYPPLNLGKFGKSNVLSLIFPTAGRFGYHNHFDATQTGTIIVSN